MRTTEEKVNKIQQFFYRLSPRSVRVLFWGMDDDRLLLPRQNMFRFMRDGAD
jgi:hypothetical protein